MIQLTEKDLKEQIKSYLQAMGGYVVSLAGSVFLRRGVPDIIACYQGRFIAIEVKGPKGKLTPAQEEELMLIEAAYGRAIVAHSLEDVVEMLEGVGGFILVTG